MSSRTSKIMVALWRNWAFSFGAVVLPMMFALFMPPLMLPFVCFIGGLLLITHLRADVNSGLSSCSLTVRLSAKILMISAVAMAVIAIVCTDWIIPTVVQIDLYNTEIPFITCLVIFPITAVICACSLIFGYGQRRSRQCQHRNGFFVGDNIIATMYYRENKYQVSIMLLLSIIIGAIEYWYYFARYINSDINDPDRFFFNYIPLAMYLLSLFLFWGRYVSMGSLFQSLDPEGLESNKTKVRFLIFRNDELLLHNGVDGKWDTPAEVIINRTHDLGEQRAQLLLMEQSGLQNFVLRYCYTNEGFAEGSTIVHYAVFIDEDEKVSDSDQWFNNYMIDTALATNTISPMLASELYRIHTMTMAWKTYDREGHRLYPIKHYRPTFRLRDLRHWEVDYDDYAWFDVAHNNEDRHFFRTRQLWHKLTDIFRPQSPKHSNE